MKKLDSSIQMDPIALDGTFLGNRVAAVDGLTNIEGPLEDLRHEIDIAVMSVQMGQPARIVVRTHLTIGGHLVTLTRGARVTVS